MNARVEQQICVIIGWLVTGLFLITRNNTYYKPVDSVALRRKQVIVIFIKNFYSRSCCCKQDYHVTIPCVRGSASEIQTRLALTGKTAKILLVYGT